MLVQRYIGFGPESKGFAAGEVEVVALCDTEIV